MNSKFTAGLAQREAAALESQRSNQPLVIWPEDKLLADIGASGAQAVFDTLPGLLTPGEVPGWTLVAISSPKLEEFASFLETEYAYATSIPRTRVYKYKRKK